MGRVFFENWGGRSIYQCEACGVYLSNKSEVISKSFKGVTGQAYLFRNVANVRKGEVNVRDMLTGKHHVRDVFCLNCDTKLGWMYEYAWADTESYKEGAITLECKLFTVNADALDDAFTPSSTVAVGRRSASSVVANAAPVAAVDDDDDDDEDDDVDVAADDHVPAMQLMLNNHDEVRAAIDRVVAVVDDDVHLPPTNTMYGQVARDAHREIINQAVSTATELLRRGPQRRRPRQEDPPAAGPPPRLAVHERRAIERLLFPDNEPRQPHVGRDEDPEQEARRQYVYNLMTAGYERDMRPWLQTLTHINTASARREREVAERDEQIERAEREAVEQVEHEQRVAEFNARAARLPPRVVRNVGNGPAVIEDPIADRIMAAGYVPRDLIFPELHPEILNDRPVIPLPR